MKLQVIRRFRITQDMNDALVRCCQITGFSPSEIMRGGLTREMKAILKLAKTCKEHNIEMDWKEYGK